MRHRIDGAGNLPHYTGTIGDSNLPHSSLPVSSDAATHLDPDDGDATIFRNVGNSFPVDIASHVFPTTQI